MADAPHSRARATFEDVLPMLERDEEVELIDGEIVPRAAPMPEHGAAQATLAALLYPYQRRVGGPRGPGGWWIMTEVEVHYAKTDEVFRHDALGFRRSLHPERPRGFPVAVRPDWIAEILSIKTAPYDVVKKQRTLHLRGVPHYWILDPEHETLTVLRWAETAYLRVLDAGIGDVVPAEPFGEVEISVAELFGRGE